MKVAILLHGLAGKTDKYNTGSDLPVDLAYKHLKKHIYDVNPEVEFDVFMHSWSVAHEKDLCELYNPVKYEFEPQIIFDFEYIVGDPNGPGGPINKWHDGKFRGLDNLRFHSMFSRWYSAKMVNELKKNYEKENNFNYDYVMFTRYDLAYVEDFIFSDFEEDKIYAVGPDGGIQGMHDLWLITNSHNMDVILDNETKCTGMFDNLRLVDHFPDKITHSHFWLRMFMMIADLTKKIRFFGSPRPWVVGHQRLGPSPPVRSWYDSMNIPATDEDMGKERQNIRNISERTVRNTPDGGIQYIKTKEVEDGD